MSWSKTIKGSFAEVRNALHTIAADVHNDDVKGGASDKVREAHHLQARVAVTAAEQLTAHIPFQATNTETHEDRDLEFQLYGSGNEDGSGNVGVGYKIGPEKPKEKIVS